MDYGFHWHHYNPTSLNYWKDNNCFSICKLSASLKTIINPIIDELTSKHHFHHSNYWQITMDYGFHWHHDNAESQNYWKVNNYLSISKGYYMFYLNHFQILYLINLHAKITFIIVINGKSQWTMVFIGIMLILHPYIIGRLTIVFL